MMEENNIPPNGERGFTMIELLVVVAIIAILAGIGVAVYRDYRSRAEVASTATDLRNFAAAFWAYANENEQGFPADTNMILPAGMEPYISATVWYRGAAVGGQYNWEGPSFYPYSGIAIMNPPSNDILTALDRELDDGNLTTGRFRIILSNMRPTYIIDE